MTDKQKIYWIDYYKHETGKREIDDFGEVADFALQRGYVSKEPPTVREMVARELAEAASRHRERDPLTGRSYRKHLCIPRAGAGNMGLWVDADDNVPRTKMERMARAICEEVVSRIANGQEIFDRWSSRHPEKEPVSIPTDLTFDVELRKNSREEDEEAGRKTG